MTAGCESPQSANAPLASQQVKKKKKNFHSLQYIGLPVLAPSLTLTL